MNETYCLLDNHNIIRAMEIALLGQHNICVVFQDDISPMQREIVKAEVSKYIPLVNITKADMILEYRLPDSYALTNGRIKTLEDSLDRLKAIEPFSERIEVDPASLDSTCTTLLRTAIDRLNLEPHRIQKILNVAKTISLLDKSENIKTADLAEAIHYQHVDKEFFEKEYLLKHEVVAKIDKLILDFKLGLQFQNLSHDIGYKLVVSEKIDLLEQLKESL